MKRGASALRHIVKCCVDWGVTTAEVPATASVGCEIVRSELTTNPNGRSGALLTEQHGGRSPFSAGAWVSSLGQHDIGPIACIACMLIEHCITWSPGSSASPASAHNRMVSARVAISAFRIVALFSIASAYSPTPAALGSVTTVTSCQLFRRPAPQKVPAPCSALHCYGKGFQTMRRTALFAAILVATLSLAQNPPAATPPGPGAGPHHRRVGLAHAGDISRLPPTRPATTLRNRRALPNVSSTRCRRRVPRPQPSPSPACFKRRAAAMSAL